MQPKSLMRMRLIRRTIPLVIRDAVLRNQVSCRSRRTVLITSWPRRNRSTRAGISSGGFCRSASRVMIHSPRACMSPAVTGVLAEVARERDQHQLRNALLDLLEHRQRGVGAAVVDADRLPRQAQGLHDRDDA